MGPEAETVLDLEARRRIVDAVRASPGLHLRALAEQLGMPVSTLEYHCYHLQKHGHLDSRVQGGFKAFFPGQGMDRRDKDLLGLLRHEGPRRIATHLVLHPGATPGDLKDVTKLSAPTLSFHLKRMRQGGMLREEPEGRTKRLFVVEPERVANLLVAYRPTFADDVVDRFSAAWLSLAPRDPAAPASPSGPAASSAPSKEGDRPPL